MTEEMMKLTPRELRKYQRAVGIVGKVHGLSCEEIDGFFRLAKNARALMELIVKVAGDQSELNRNILSKNDTEAKETATSLFSTAFGGTEGGHGNQ